MIKKAIFLSSLTLLAACTGSYKTGNEQLDGFRDSQKWGDVITQDITLDKFHGIHLTTNATVYFTQSDEVSAYIKGNENVISWYAFTTEDGILCDRMIEDAASSMPYVCLYVSAPSLDMIHVSGSGDIKLRQEMEVGDLEIMVDGSGDIEFHDLSCHNLTITSNGSGDIKLRTLKAYAITSTLNASGDIDFKYAECETQAECTSNGSGDIDGDIIAKSITAKSAGSGDIDLEVSCQSVTALSEGAGEIEIEGETCELIKSAQALGTLTTKKLKADKVSIQ